jgi:CRP-like cAMP-binding protein
MESGGDVHSRVLAVTADLPDRQVAVGEAVLELGEAGHELIVLVEGSLVAEVDGMMLSTTTEPGSFLGEVAVLLDRSRTATVRAATPSTIRVIPDAAEFLEAHPELLIEVARVLALRLAMLTAYLADLRHQYGDRSDQLGMVDKVLAALSTSTRRPMEPGSDRDADYT